MTEPIRPPVSRAEPTPPAGIDAAPQPHQGMVRPKRLRRRFTIPAAARIRETDPKTIVLQELDVAEVDTARKLAEGDRTKSLIEQVKLSLFEVDGKVVDHTRDEGTYFYNSWSQKVRELAVLGYDAVASNKAEVVDDFLSSMEGA